MITGIETRAITRMRAERGRTGGAGGRFEVTDAPEGPRGAVGAGVAALSLDGLLAMQEDRVEDDPNRRARTGGAAILAELAAMQHAMLGQGDPAGVARRLDGLLASLPDATDPGLAGILRQITLRARIEMLRAGGADRADVTVR